MVTALFLLNQFANPWSVFVRLRETIGSWFGFGPFGSHFQNILRREKDGAFLWKNGILWATDLRRLGRCCLRPIITDPFSKPNVKVGLFGPVCRVRLNGSTCQRNGFRLLVPRRSRPNATWR